MNDPELHQPRRRFLVVDDHPMFREALKGALGASFPDPIVQEADSIRAARAVLHIDRDIDLVLLDLSLRRFDGFEGLIGLRKEFPFVPVLVVSGLDEARVMHEALCLGASGFVPKAAGRALLAEAITSVLSGKIYLPRPGSTGRDPVATRPMDRSGTDRAPGLTSAQARVLAMIRKGMQNREIAAELGIGESTVKAHVSHIIRKLGVVSRTQIVIEAARTEIRDIRKPG